MASLPEWNGRQLGVTGSSQGGFLSLSTAALDPRVTFIGVVHDALCDHESELKGVAGGWPHYFYKAKNVDPKRIEGARYYDGVNFARRVKCDSWFSFGYNDEVVPPTSSYSTYNIVTHPRLSASINRLATSGIRSSGTNGKTGCLSRWDYNRQHKDRKRIIQPAIDNKSIMSDVGLRRQP